MNAKSLCLPALVALAALAMPADRAHARSDFKFVAATDCMPFLPNTQYSELQYTVAGIYNPGNTSERVVCPLPRDQEDPYFSGELSVTVYYRGLGAPARVGCTVFVGSVFMQTQPVVTASAVSEPTSLRGSLVIDVGPQDDEFDTVPVQVVCTLEPKMALAGIFLDETGPTNIP